MEIKFSFRACPAEERGIKIAKQRTVMYSNDKSKMKANRKQRNIDVEK